MAFAARQRGLALQKLSQPSEAVKAYRQSIALLEKLPKPEPVDVYCIASSHALIHSVALAKGSGLATADADSAAEQATTMMRRAFAAGYSDLAYLRKDSDFDSLRQHPDFQKLLAERQKESKTSGK